MAAITLTKENFNEEVLNSDVPVLVDFWATWCGPCKMIGPVVAEIADESDGSYKVGKIDVDAQPELAEQFNIMAIPSLLVFKNGEVVKKSQGAIAKGAILDLLK